MQAPAIAPWDVKQRSSSILEFVIIVPGGVSLDTALSASYWRNAWKVMENRRYSEVTFISDDGAFDVTARLLAIDATTVEWRVIREWEPKRAAGRKPNVPDGYVVEHLPGDGWRAVAPDGSIIVAKKSTESDALSAALTYSKKVAA